MVVLKQLQAHGIIELPWPMKRWELDPDSPSTPIEHLQWRLAWNAYKPELLIEALEDYFDTLERDEYVIAIKLQMWKELGSAESEPVQWAGPLRFHAPPISVADLPPIEAVILSHDHYDHLDVESIRQLANKTRYFVTPLGVGDRLIDWGVPRTKVRQLDWWQSVRIAGLELISTPAQHFSGRGLWDRNQTLWSSWVLRQQPANTPHERPISLYFSGDTGYFTGFKEIGERFGPFDLALMENGAYNPQWHYVHMFPAETLQAFIDVSARVLVPVHNGTFDLSMHAWDDPLRQITELATRRAISIRTPVFGERVDIRAPAATHAWWTEVRTK